MDKNIDLDKQSYKILKRFYNKKSISFSYGNPMLETVNNLHLETDFLDCTNSVFIHSETFTFKITQTGILAIEKYRRQLRQNFQSLIATALSIGSFIIATIALIVSITQ